MWQLLPTRPPGEERGLRSTSLLGDHEELPAEKRRAERTRGEISLDQDGPAEPRVLHGVGKEPALHVPEREPVQEERLADAAIAQWHVMVEIVPVCPGQEPDIGTHDDESSSGAEYPVHFVDHGRARWFRV